MELGLTEELELLDGSSRGRAEEEPGGGSSEPGLTISYDPLVLS